MRHLRVSYSKGQIKIQQMAFVLVAFMILFGIIALFYVSIKANTLKNEAQELRHDRAREEARKMAGTPEFIWRADDCNACIDLDKALMVKGRANYQTLWGSDVPLVQLKRIYPMGEEREIECTKSNYPHCTTLTLVKKVRDYTTEEAFVALCYFETDGSYVKCELGKIVLGVAS